MVVLASFRLLRTSFSLGWAVGMAFRRQGNCRVLIGSDTRSSGYMFESAFEAGLSASGADTLLLGPMPTPASPT